MSGYLSFAKGSILMRPNPIVCMCLGSKHNVSFSSDVAYIYLSVCPLDPHVLGSMVGNQVFHLLSPSL